MPAIDDRVLSRHFSSRAVDKKAIIERYMFAGFSHTMRLDVASVLLCAHVAGQARYEVRRRHQPPRRRRAFEVRQRVRRAQASLPWAA